MSKTAAPTNASAAHAPMAEMVTTAISALKGGMVFPTSHKEVHCRLLVRKMDDECSLAGRRSQVCQPASVQECM